MCVVSSVSWVGSREVPGERRAPPLAPRPSHCPPKAMLQTHICLQKKKTRFCFARHLWIPLYIKPTKIQLDYRFAFHIQNISIAVWGQPTGSFLSRFFFSLVSFFMCKNPCMSYQHVPRGQFLFQDSRPFEKANTSITSHSTLAWGEFNANM